MKRFFFAVTGTRPSESSQCNELRSNKRDEKFNHLLFFKCIQISKE